MDYYLRRVQRWSVAGLWLLMAGMGGSCLTSTLVRADQPGLRAPSARQAEGSGAGEATTDIQQLVRKLGGAEYRQRRKAHQQLLDLGIEAVPAVAAAAGDPSPEIATRVFSLLETWSRSPNQSLAGASVAALRELAESENPRAAKAERALESWKHFKASRIVSRLEALEAQVNVRERSHGLHITVQITENWRGDGSDLALLGELDGLRWLSLENSPVARWSLDFLHDCRDLEFLYLGDTGISASKLTPIRNLTNLKHLSLKNLAVGDDVLQPLGELKSLESLGLDGTRITDASLARLDRFPRLRVLWLDGTEISDDGLAHLEDLPELTRLYLSRTKITGTGLGHLAALPKLTYLSLKGVELSEEGASYLASLQTVETLGLDHTNATNNMLAHLVELSNLQVLWLSNTKVTDEGLEHLIAMSGLQTLYLHGAKVTRQGVERFRDEMPRCVVHF
jgi:hypothetical protein